MMKKQILNIGKALNKTEQKQINGGGYTPPGDGAPCTQSTYGSCTFQSFLGNDCATLNEICDLSSGIGVCVCEWELGG